ncbi:cytochrome C oxidase Cbb3 [uncultured Enterovirga sp.]|uniref:cytochrome C oxidase Cbb3 n=1 Tax=uncultured Enterovirga sp. TaxID=2026352 RepID=UPI0035C9F6B0
MIWVRRILLAVLALLLAGAVGAALTTRRDYVPMPLETEILNTERLPLAAAYDILGRAISRAEAETLKGSDPGRRLLLPEAGAVAIDDALVQAGREAFYRETWGNEVFLSDVVGLFDGAVSTLELALSLAELRGNGTTDLRVRLSRDVKVGLRQYRAGEIISTGLDVPRGEFVPLGLRAFYDRGRVRVGVTCALCHASVDPASGRVVEGAPNTDLASGLLLALSANPSALFPQTGIGNLDAYRTRPDNIVRTSTGRSDVLPDPEGLEPAVRAMLGAWPPGSFDTTIDAANNPTSIPTAFTAGAHPYGWSGQAAIGPFRGLSALNNSMHGMGADTMTAAVAAPQLLGIDTEIYLGTILQRAVSPDFRFDTRDGRKPSELLWTADPTQGSPGVTHLVVLPSFPAATYVTTNSLVMARPGETVSRQIDGLSAFQNRLRPPPLPRRSERDRAVIERGRATFDRAGCLACHSGPALTSNRVWPASVIGSEPSRARAYVRTEEGIAKPVVLAPDTPAPVPDEPRLLPVPVPDEGQLKLGWGHNRTGGGYKVMHLQGLRWSAPYLHDGGVAVGPDPERRAGMAETTMAGIAPDPANSLRALVDRSWRARVTAANRTSATVQLARVTGEGHAYWVDAQAGFSEEDRDALVAFLLSIDGPLPEPAPR